MDRNINNNGYEYVDLGLPSGTLWATCNVGADNPSDYGLYFQWGDTQGYTADQVETGKGKKKFAIDWSDYKWYNGGKFTKYTTYGSALELEDDAAHAHMGGDWHMPTSEQIKELMDSTTSELATMDGVDGRLFTSKKDSSKSIFIPAAGYALDGLVECIGRFGYVWSSMLSMAYLGNGQILVFGSLFTDITGRTRSGGVPVRGVIDSNRNSSKEKECKMKENLTFEEMLETEIRRILRRE